MSRVFSIPTALRALPNDLLRRLFDELKCELDLQWDALGKNDTKLIMKAIMALGLGQIEKVEAVLHTLFDLGCDTGIAAIREAEDDCDGPSPLVALSESATPFHQAVVAWIANPDVIGRAVRIHQVENLTWWRKRKDLPRRAPDLSDEALDRFERELSELLLVTEGRGRNCTLERMTRKGTEYVFARPDDFAQNATAHDKEGRFASLTFRHTFPIIFAFNPTEGTLETFAKLSYRTKPKVEALFAKILLDTKELPKWPKRQTYQLNHLKPRSFVPETDDDRVKVEIRLMRFKYVSNNRQMIFEGDPSWSRDTHNLLDDALNQDRVPLSALNLTMVALEFVYSDELDPKAVTVNVSTSGGCNLRNLPPHRADMIQKYLRRWGIDAEQPPDGDLAAAG